VLCQPEVGGVDHAPLLGAADRFQRIALEGARLHLDEGDDAAALDDEVDLAERGLIAAGEEPEALGEEEGRGQRLGEMAVAIGGAPAPHQLSPFNDSAFW
jgi:hypothetical protein